MAFGTEVTEAQKALARTKRAALEQLLRAGLENLRDEKLPAEGIPILGRLIDLLEAIDADPGQIAREVFRSEGGER